MMFKNYLKIALRIIGRRKGYSIINIAGLSVGMACFILIMLYVRYELSYDDFHENKDRIYRVIMHQPGDLYLGSDHYCVTWAPLADALINDYPEVEYATKTTFWSTYSLMVKDEKKSYKNGLYADEKFFNILSFEWLHGIRETALAEPNSIVIDREMAEYFFGDINPVGESISVEGGSDYEITGVIENVPENSHLKFNFLLPFITQFGESEREEMMSSWYNNSYWTYLLLKQGADPKELERKIQSLYGRYTDGQNNRDMILVLQPIKQIHLQAGYNFDTSEIVDKKFIYLFSSIAVLVLLIAYINYINLSIAGASRRAKEIGIRKVVGALRKQLFRQFNGEFILFSLISVFIGIIAVYMILPYFSSFVEKEIEFQFIENWKFLASVFGFTVITGIICGSYPALFMSAFKPVEIITGKLSNRFRKKNMRGVFVVTQFCISIILIICGITVYTQLDFIENRDIGYNREQVLTFRVRDRGIRRNVAVLKEELLQYPDIVNLTTSQSLPTSITSGGISGFKDDKGEDKTIYAHTCIGDFDFLDVYEIELLEGRNFNESFGTDVRKAILVNESFVKEAKLDNILGKTFKFWGDEEQVIGIVKDFNFQSMHLGIKPIVIKLRPYPVIRMAIRIRPDKIPDTIDHIKTTYDKYSTNHPFDYFFVDESFNRLYKFEQKLGVIFAYFSFLAIFIAGLGLFGLSMSATETRIKEIGIRKTLGATVRSIIQLLSKEFTGFLLISNLIAFPVAYLGMDYWLDNFAYKIDLGIWIFIASAAISLLIALLTVSYQVIKSAMANPVESLKYE
ncbi:MAG: FtsX-like permease family protein, partial [bacterium]|nr:FtsX-like permease family protein [bacterium]